MTIREALRELDLWGAAATFNLTEYTDSSRRTLTLIKDWKDVVNQVSALKKQLKKTPFILRTFDLLGLPVREQT